MRQFLSLLQNLYWSSGRPCNTMKRLQILEAEQTRFNSDSSCTHSCINQDGLSYAIVANNSKVPVINRNLYYKNNHSLEHEHRVRIYMYVQQSSLGFSWPVRKVYFFFLLFFIPLFNVGCHNQTDRKPESMSKDFFFLHWNTNSRQ